MEKIGRFEKIIISGLVIIAALSFWLLPEKTPPEKPLAEMTQEERTTELQRILNKAGIILPDDWQQMSRQERGKFLLSNGLLDAIGEE